MDVSGKGWTEIYVRPCVCEFRNAIRRVWSCCFSTQSRQMALLSLPQKGDTFVSVIDVLTPLACPKNLLHKISMAQRMLLRFAPNMCNKVVECVVHSAAILQLLSCVTSIIPRCMSRQKTTWKTIAALSLSACNDTHRTYTKTHHEQHYSSSMLVGLHAHTHR